MPYLLLQEWSAEQNPESPYCWHFAETLRQTQSRRGQPSRRTSSLLRSRLSLAFSFIDSQRSGLVKVRALYAQIACASFSEKPSPTFPALCLSDAYNREGCRPKRGLKSRSRFRGRSNARTAEQDLGAVACGAGASGALFDQSNIAISFGPMNGAYTHHWLLHDEGHLHRGKPADLAVTCSGGKFVGSRAREAYNGRASQRSKSEILAKRNL